MKWNTCVTEKKLNKMKNNPDELMILAVNCYCKVPNA